MATIRPRAEMAFGSIAIGLVEAAARIVQSVPGGVPEWYDADPAFRVLYGSSQVEFPTLEPVWSISRYGSSVLEGFNPAFSLRCELWTPRMVNLHLVRLVLYRPEPLSRLWGRVIEVVYFIRRFSVMKTIADSMIDGSRRPYAH